VAPKLVDICKTTGPVVEAKRDEKKAGGGDYDPDEPRPGTAPAPGASSKRIMLSYQWDNQPTIKRIAELLKSAGYNVWLDLDQMSGSTISAMAEAVEGSAVVLVALSSKYQGSKNCRLEGEYAHLTSKTIIPLMMENNYRPSGWLGLIMGGKLWFDFSTPDKHDASFKNLLGELTRAVGPATGTPATGTSSSSSSSSSAPPPPPTVDRFKDAPAFLKAKGVTARVQLDSVCLNELAKMRAKEGASVVFVNFLLANIVEDLQSALKLSAALE